MPIEFGTVVYRRFITIAHRSKASIGYGKMSAVIGCLTKDNMRDMINLADSRVPKYTASILLLRATAYTLGEIGSDG